MDQIAVLLNQIGIFAVMLAVGFLARKMKLADKSVFDALTVFTVKVLLPLFMLTTLPGTKDAAGAGKVVMLFGIFMIFYAVMYLLSLLSNRLFHMKDELAVANMAVTTTTCAGFVGLPIASAMYGAYGALVMALYSAFDNFTTWTHKAYVFNQSAKDKNVIWWKKMINPQIVCVVVGILLAVWKIDFTGNVVWDSLYHVGEMAKYMGMLFLGSTLADLNRTFLQYIKPVLYIVIVRMGIFPAVFGVMVKYAGLLDMRDTVLLTVILATPPMASVPTIIKSFGMDESYAAQCLIFTTMASLCTLPAVLWIVIYAFGN
ncbi:MAG TPA: hypothetical protein DD414_00290 [Lachnospiraceae bacterium]|nr:hypothetical protein [Lachnospiraceae bacterium]